MEMRAAYIARQPGEQHGIGPGFRRIALQDGGAIAGPCVLDPGDLVRQLEGDDLGVELDGRCAPAAPSARPAAIIHAVRFMSCLLCGPPRLWFRPARQASAPPRPRRPPPRRRSRAYAAAAPRALASGTNARARPPGRA